MVEITGRMAGEITLSKNATENLGEWWAWGVLRGVAKAFVLVWVVGVLVGAAIYAAGDALKLGPSDDTDLSWSDRSGVKLRHDALTGCEYLETTRGGITPRLGTDGKQVCRLQQG